MDLYHACTYFYLNRKQLIRKGRAEDPWKLDRINRMSSYNSNPSNGRLSSPIPYDNLSNPPFPDFST